MYFSTDASAALKQIVKTGRVAIDVETTGLDPHQSKCGVITLESGGKLYLLREIPTWMDALIQDPDTYKMIYNAKFDLQYLMTKRDISYARNIQDLYLKEVLVSDERRGLRHDLASSLQRRIGVEIAKDIDHAQVNWAGALTPEMEQYCVEDIVYMDDLDKSLSALLQEQGQVRAAAIDNNAVCGTAWMTYNGIGVDREAWEAAIPEWQVARQVALDELNKVWPGVENWNSTFQARRAVEKYAKIVMPDMQHATVIIMAEYIPELHHYLVWKMWDTRLNNWGHESYDSKGNVTRDSYMNRFVNPKTGRIHPSWWQIGTGTGRYSCSAPNLQQIPRDKKFRALFKARPGYQLVSLDYKAIEMLVAGVIAGDRAMIEACATGDPHTFVATTVLNVQPSEVDSDIRQLAKSMGFGLLFGGGAEGLRHYARSSYGVVIEPEKAPELVKQFFTAFPSIKAMRSKAYSFFRCALCQARFKLGDEMALQTCDHLQKVLVVRNLVGMRRVLRGPTLKPTTWLNTQIQSSAGYGIKAALRFLGEAGLIKNLCLQIHDELVFEVETDRVNEFVDGAHTCMVRGMRSVLGNVPVRVDVSVGDTWS